MPKKKLTKAQIKKKLTQIHKLLFELERDRMEHINHNHFYGISLGKLMTTSDMIARGVKKIK
jgi:dolichol kinase